MSKWKKLTKGIVAAVMLVTLVSTAAKTSGMGTVHAEEPVTQPVTQSVEITVPDNKVPTYEYRKAQDFVLNIKNTGEEEIKNFVIEPVLQKDDNQKWPFKTAYQKYSEKIETLAVEKSKQVKFNFTERDDISTSRYTIQFEYTADNGISGSCSFYVNTTAKPEEKKQEVKQEPAGSNSQKDSNEKTKVNSESVEAGGFGNSEAVYSDGGGGSTDGSVPRVIVTGFSTNPEKVKAGTDFTLTIHLKNTSKKSKVKNMLFDLNAPVEGTDEQTSAPAFLPSSGSSSIFLDGMKAGGTADISIKLNAKSDLLQKPYSVELSMKYEDANSNPVEATSSISIPIKQDARFEFSDFEINPESISVGDEANVMCNLYNLGRIKLYNVKATFEGNGIEKEEVFVGNVESGATASIDAMLTGVAATQGPEMITMTMSYENEEGEVTTAEKELMLEVTEMADESMGADMEIPEEKKGGLPVIPILVGVLLIAVALAAVVIMKKHRKKKNIEEEEEFMYELDGSSEDERQ